MSDVEQSPEFQEALRKACEEEYNTHIFGDRRKAKAAEKLPPSVQEAMKEAGRIRRQAESMRHRAESQMHGGEVSEMFNSPTLPRFPEDLAYGNLETYRREVDIYAEQVRRQAQMLSDPTIEGGLERFKMKGSGLECPECHDSDHGNKMNKTPWCMKCNCALESPTKKSGKKQLKINLHPKTEPHPTMSANEKRLLETKEEYEEWERGWMNISKEEYKRKEKKVPNILRGLPDP